MELNSNSFLQYNGITGNMWSVPLKKNEKCVVCSKKIFRIKVDPKIPLESFVEFVEKQLEIEIISPIVVHKDKIIYRFKSFADNDELKRLDDLKSREIKNILENGAIIFIEDENTSVNFKLEVIYYEEFK